LSLLPPLLRVSLLRRVLWRRSRRARTAQIPSPIPLGRSCQRYRPLGSNPLTENVELSKGIWSTIQELVHTVMIALESGSSLVVQTTVGETTADNLEGAFTVLFFFSEMLTSSACSSLCSPNSLLPTPSCPLQSVSDPSGVLLQPSSDTAKGRKEKPNSLVQSTRPSTLYSLCTSQLMISLKSAKPDDWISRLRKPIHAKIGDLPSFC